MSLQRIMFVGVAFGLLLHSVSQAEDWQLDVNDHNKMDQLEADIARLDQSGWEKVALAWTQRLTDDEASVYEKRAICRLMALRGIGPAAEALAKCLADDGLTGSAARALVNAAMAGNAAAKSELLKAIRSLDGRPLTIVLQQVGRMDIERFSEVLKPAERLAESEDVTVKRAALNVIAAGGRPQDVQRLHSMHQAGDSEATPALLACLERLPASQTSSIHQDLAQDLTALAPTHSHAVLRGLAQSDAVLAARCAADLLKNSETLHAKTARRFLVRQCTDAMEQALLEDITSSSPVDQCMYVLEALKHRRSGKVFDKAWALYEKASGDDSLRLRLMDIVCHTIPPDRSGQIVRMMLDVPSEEKAILERAIVQHPSEQVDQALVHLVKAEDTSESKGELIALLGDRQNPAVEESLLTWLQSERFGDQRTRILDALQTCGGRASLEYLMAQIDAHKGTPPGDLVKTMHGLCAVAPSQCRAQVIESLIAKLGSAKDDERARVFLDGLVATGDDKALEYLTEHLDLSTGNQDRDAKMAAALAQWPTLNALDSLFSICQDATLAEPVRVACFRGTVARVRREKSLSWDGKAELLMRSFDAAPTVNEKKIVLGIVDRSAFHVDTYQLFAKAMKETALAPNAARAVVTFSGTFLGPRHNRERCRNNKLVVGLLEQSAKVAPDAYVAERAKTLLDMLKSGK